VPEIARTTSRTQKFDDMEVKILYAANMVRLQVNNRNTGNEI